MAEVLGDGKSARALNLQVTPDQKATLGELRGKPVVLALLPADWSAVCGDQISLHNESLPEFAKHEAQLVRISVDGMSCHGAFSAARHLRLPPAAYFEPKGEVVNRRIVMSYAIVGFGPASLT